MSDEEIKDMDVRLGDFLAERVCPATGKEELFMDVWSAASPEEKRVLAGIVLRMVE